MRREKGLPRSGGMERLSSGGNEEEGVIWSSMRDLGEGGGYGDNGEASLPVALRERGDLVMFA